MVIKPLQALVVALGTALSVATVPAARAAERSGQADSSQSTPAIRNIVLVHGAFSDGSVWSPVIALLQKKGYRVTAVQNPLTSLADDVAATRRVLARQQGDVLLVGHSWAGAVVTEAGNAPNVKGLVYLSALVPDSDESAAEMLAKRGVPMEGLQPDAEGLIWLDDAAAYGRVMAADLPKRQVAVLAATQQPLAAVGFTQRISHAAWKDKPSWYVIADNDRALPTPVQRWIAARIGARSLTLKTSHMSLLAKPAAVAAFIDQAARQPQ